MAKTSYIHPLLDVESAIKSVFEATDTPLMALSRKGDLLLLNWRMQTVTGFVPGRALQANFLSEAMDPAEGERLLAHVKRFLDGETPENEPVGWTFRTGEGGERAIPFTALPVQDSTGEAIGVVYVGIRAPSHVTAAHAVVTSEGAATATAAGTATTSTTGARTDEYRSPRALTEQDQDENISSLVFSIDVASGRISSMNQVAAYLLGYYPRDFRDDPKLLSARVLPEYHEAFEAALMDVQRGVARSIEVGFARQDNELVILAMMLYPGRDKQGKVISVEGIGRDITARKDAEQQLAESHWELQAAYDRLQAQHEELQSLERLKSQVLANVSHELRTPLVTIRGYNELLLADEMGRLNDRQRRGLEISGKSIQRLLALIENLIDFARLERDRVGLSAERVDLYALLTDVVSDCAESMREKQLRVKLDFSPEQLTLLGDRGRLYQAFRNLVDNAEKFTDPTGTIQIGLRLEGEEIRLSVVDSGIGIPAEEQDRIFDTFYQVDGSSTRPYPGVGIGLAIVREIIRLHGGRIEVESEMGQGSRFDVVLPTAEARKRALASALASHDRPTQEVLEGGELLDELLLDDDILDDEVTSRELADGEDSDYQPTLKFMPMTDQKSTSKLPTKPLRGAGDSEDEQ